MADSGYQDTGPASGGNRKIFLIIGGLLIFGLLALAVFGLFLAYTLGWFGGGSDIIVGFPDSDNNFDIYLVKLGESEDDGVRLVKEAQIGDNQFYVFQEYGVAKMILGAGFVPDSDYLFLAYNDEDESVFEQMRIREDEPSDLFSSDDYAVVMAFPEQKNVIIIEYRDDETRCYVAHFGEEADRVAKGLDCLLLPDGESIIVVEEKDEEYTFTAVNTTTGDEHEFLTLEAMLDLYYVSFDGTHLAYIEDAGDETELHLVDIEEEDDEKIADGFGIPIFEFAPVGSDFYYMVEDDDGNLALYVNDDNDPVAEGQMLSAQFGPKGENLIYVVGDEPDDLVASSYSLKNEESVEITDGEGLQVAVLQNPSLVVIKETQDDGDEIYYASSPDGEDVEEITDLKDVIYSSLWSVPGQEYVFLLAHTEDGVSAFAYPIGGEGYFFVEEWADFNLLSISPNSRYLAFSGVEDEGDDQVLYYVDLAAEDDPEELDDDAEWFENAVFTSNSRELVYTAGTGEDFDEVEVRQVLIADPDPDAIYDEAYLMDASWAKVNAFSGTSFSSLQVGESYCPGAVSLSENDPVDISLGADETQCFRFTAGAEEIWQVDIDSYDDEQDLAATLVDRDGNELIYSDDGLWDYDPWLAYRFVSGGVYYVEVGDLNGVAGDFTIELLAGEDMVENAEPIELGEEISGTITFDPPAYFESPEVEEGAIGGLAALVYQINLDLGDTVTFIVTNNDGAELYMGILDEDFYWLYEDDSTFDYGESSITVTAEETGSYYLMVYYFSLEEPDSLSQDITVTSMAGEASGDQGGAYGEISYDETVSGNLSNGTRDQWEFYGYSGESVSIALESSDFDSYLELLDPYGYQVASDDDGGGNRNSLIEYTLTSSGYFTIVARSYGDSGSGEYTLSLEQVILEEVEQGESGGVIEFGGMVTGYLSDGAEDVWEFEGTAGDVVSVFLYSEDFDCVVELHDSDGNEVAYDDDSGEEGDSLIESFTLENSGTFTIVARAYGNSGTGNYELYLWLEEGSEPEVETTPEGQEGTIDVGDTVTTDLVSGAEDHWTFDGESGDAITITLSSEDFDAYLEIYNANDTLVGQNDDGGGNSDSMIWGLILPNDGTYTIVARSFGDAGGGEYTLSLEDETFPVAGSLDYGDSTTGSLVPGTRGIWSFSGSAGDEVTITLTSDDFDTYLELRDADGTILAYNDDFDGSNSAIEYELLGSGTYLIIVRAYTSYAEGDYTISVTD